MLLENLDGEFLGYISFLKKSSVIGAQKERNEGRGVLVKPSALLCRLCTLQVCPVEVVVGGGAFAFLDVEIGAAAMAAVVAAAFCYHFV